MKETIETKPIYNDRHEQDRELYATLLKHIGEVSADPDGNSMMSGGGDVAFVITAIMHKEGDAASQIGLFQTMVSSHKMPQPVGPMGRLLNWNTSDCMAQILVEGPSKEMVSEVSKVAFLAAAIERAGGKAIVREWAAGRTKEGLDNEEVYRLFVDEFCEDGATVVMQ